MRQTIAILVDSVRQLRARKLFWFVLALSVLVVIGFASIGFDDKGPVLFFGLKHLEQPMLVKGSPFADLLLNGIFSVFICNIWLAWGAMILAIISTCGILPDFLGDGAIDLVLSKPVSRVRVFLTKYVGSLMFVFMQVLVFCAGIYLVFGLRHGDWTRWDVFWAVPLITLMFSYIYSIAALVGVRTRSTLPALLFTVLAWMGISMINIGHGVLTALDINVTVAVEECEERIAPLEVELAQFEADGNTLHAADRQRAIDAIREEQDSYASARNYYGPFLPVIRGAAYILPKTGETVDLIQYRMKADTSLSFNDLLEGRLGKTGEELEDSRRNNNDAPSFFGSHEVQKETQRRFVEYFDRRNPWYIIGSSLLFEFVLVGFAAFLFVRQDF